jgi:hypothetical protein
MATKKSKTVKSSEPIVIRGSHSTRTEYPDGRVEFVTHWDELVRDVTEALAEYDKTKVVEKPKRTPKAKKTVDAKR